MTTDTRLTYSQLKQAHWNVKSGDFIQLHALYDTVAADVRPAIARPLG